jgi:hypothetical protein
MKTLFISLCLLIFVSSASATVYKWVDDKGVENYADDMSKVPPGYRDKVEEVTLPKTGPSAPSQTLPKNIIVGARSGETTTKAPPISQTLIREGDFAIKLVEALMVGQAKSEAEAESMLASVGIAPQNGWIADYPVTPDIIGELEKAVGEAADAKRLPIGRDEALKTFRTAAAELELPIIAEVPDRYAESPPPTNSQYTEPSVINNYYDAEGPPVVTYYPPPPDYYYLYAWIPSPFWYTGFYFPGFYVLQDFHRVIFINRHLCVITNHIRDHRTGRIFTLDPVGRHGGRIRGGEDTHHRRGFNSMEARNGARSIFERSREPGSSGHASIPRMDRGLNSRNPDTSKSIPRHGHERQPIYNREERPLRFNHRDGALQRPPVTNQRINKNPGETNNRNPDTSKSISRSGTERQPFYNREGRPLGFNGRNVDQGRPPVIDHRMKKIPGETGPRGMRDRIFRQPNNMSRRNEARLQRPSAGETRSFSLPSRGNERSFSPPLQGRDKHLSSSPMSRRGFFKPHQEVNRGNRLGSRGF